MSNLIPYLKEKTHVTERERLAWRLTEVSVVRKEEKMYDRGRLA